MTRQEKKSMLVTTIRVVDSSSTQHTVEEWGDFIRVRYMDGTWSDWTRAGGRLLRGREHINPTEDNNVFVVAMTGEKLTACPPSE